MILGIPGGIHIADIPCIFRRSGPDGVIGGLQAEFQGVVGIQVPGIVVFQAIVDDMRDPLEGHGPVRHAQVIIEIAEYQGEV